MKIILTTILIFTASVLVGQSYSFINGAWGLEQCQEEPCGDLEMPSEMYWRDSVISVCIVQNQQHITQSFRVLEIVDNQSLFQPVDYLIHTYEGYIVHLTGYTREEKLVILNANFYFEGALVGLLTYPILY